MVACANPLSIKASFYIPGNRLNFLTLKGFRTKISMQLVYQYIAIIFNFSPTSSHLHLLQVENCDSNSRLVVDEDYNVYSGSKGLSSYFLLLATTKVPSLTDGKHLLQLIMSYYENVNTKLTGWGKENYSKVDYVNKNIK